jgi:hypothetical protein
MTTDTPKPRTHPFTAVDGRLLRVVEYEDGHHLESAHGSIGPCRLTGPEILKLATEGRRLWDALTESCSPSKPSSRANFRT